MSQFVRGDSTNLPRVEQIMILEYMRSNDKYNIAEIRGAKALMSSEDSYIDNAVGYVEVKRSQSECIVRAKVVPEHKVTSKQYAVTVTMREKEGEVFEATCEGCVASAGGCKHTLLILYWLAKRSSEPASTSVECHWRKPKLSGIRADPITSDEIFPRSKKLKLADKDPLVLANFLKFCKKENISDCLSTSFLCKKVSFNLFDMAVEYLNENIPNYENFIQYLDNKVTPDVVKNINIQTKQQVNSPLWHSICQGRISASKIYEASKCRTDGSLVQQILGGYKVPETNFIKRGRKLEILVIQEAEKLLKVRIEKSGFLLINGVIGASPDGVTKTFIVEVKCPSSNKTRKK